MSYGKAQEPCNEYENWSTNPGLCGKCAWAKQDHPGHENPVFIPEHTGSEYKKKRGPNFTKPKKKRRK